MARLTRDKWLAEGLKILAEFAQHKIRVLYLCERLGVTRGSFYHHFESIEDFIQALLEHWERENTLAFIEATRNTEDPSAKMAVLNEQVLQADQAVEAAIRSWSYYHPVVKEVLDRVDRTRLDFLKTVFVQMGIPTQRAAGLAQLDYATLIGLQQLNPTATPEELTALFRLYSEVHWSQQ